ncbi:MAG: trypsin-like peptidase domain-containing protein [Pseudomonadota bacterium]
MLLKFLYRHIMLGLALAFVVLLGMIVFYPDLFRAQHTIEIKQVPADPSNAATPTAFNVKGPFSYASAVEAAAPAIVNIYTTKHITQHAPLFEDPLARQFFDNFSPPLTRTERSLGSGVLISPDGYLLSNNHVVENAEEILVALQDGRTTTARVIGSDPETDLSLLKTDLNEELPIVILGNAKALHVGDVVLAIGNPYGVGQTVTMGIVSGLGRNNLGINTFENFIQTDAAINPGNSGGGLINARGELIGINSAIYSRTGGSQGIGFAIPVDLAVSIMGHLIKYGYVVRGWLGIETQNITPELAASFGVTSKSGVLITMVYRNSPAHIAGIHPGDILQQINDQEITTAYQAMDYITQQKPNSQVRLLVLRNQQQYEVPLKVIQRPRI